MNKWITGSSIAVLALCGFSLMAKAPAGWFAAGNKPADYDISPDPTAAYMGLPSVRLKSTKPEIQGFGTMMQSIGAEQYQGKRIRFSAFVSSENIAEWAGLWVRVDKGKDSVAFDNMQQRAKGTSEWKSYQVVLDVPEDATGISFGILLSGTGSALINGAKFEVVDRNVPVTNTSITSMGKPSAGPKNLSFEN